MSNVPENPQKFSLWVLYFNTYTFHILSITAKRQDEDYDEQVEETLQDEVSLFPIVST